MFCFTGPQVEAVCRWAAGLWAAVGHLRAEENLGAKDGIGTLFNEPPSFPVDSISGAISRHFLQEHMKHVGMIGHLHCSRNKWDPAGFPWEDAEKRIAKLWDDYCYNLEIDFRLKG